MMKLLDSRHLKEFMGLSSLPKLYLFLFDGYSHQHIFNRHYLIELLLVTTHLNGAIALPNNVLFTDLQFGFLQNIRSAPQLPAQVCRWVPGTTDIRVVADGLAAPKWHWVLLGREGRLSDRHGPELQYANSLEEYLRRQCSHVWLWALAGEQTTFAMPSVVFPDRIKADEARDIESTGKALGEILVAGSTANLALGQNGMVLLLNEDKLLLATLSGSTTSTGPKSAAWEIASDFKESAARSNIEDFLDFDSYLIENWLHTCQEVDVPHGLNPSVFASEHNPNMANPAHGFLDHCELGTQLLEDLYQIQVKK
ncbi:hypothetical protein BKA65DRAFT_540910 [Rhexocercosporidium sp. MPI-PUGE-AT-0058]|nr:hypothetical protein BKA65DRAFT_540910 [Rhexocercosporidium sp. MPI-PUGE-AT-0058]